MKKLILLFLVFASWAILADGKLSVGDKVPPLSLRDKNDAPFTFAPGPRYLLITFEMDTGKAANKILHAKGAGYLPKQKALYVSNIYGMPKVGRIFALPKMRRYDHPILLADAKGLLDPFPAQKDRVTVLTLDAEGKIEKISFWNPAKEPDFHKSGD